MTAESASPDIEVRRAWLDMNPSFREHMITLMLEGNPDILALPVLCSNIAQNILTDIDASGAEADPSPSS
ncbi:hypothetical protein BH09PAT4_BH09PAT4_07490 [soil metagenome]